MLFIIQGYSIVKVDLMVNKSTTNPSKTKYIQDGNLLLLYYPLLSLGFLIVYAAINLTSSVL